MEISEKERNNLSVHNRSDSINYIQASKKPLNKYKKSAAKRFIQSCSESPNSNKDMKCYRCNGEHMATKCTEENLFCTLCKIQGHNFEACFKRKGQQNVNLIDEEDDEAEIQSFDFL